MTADHKFKIFASLEPFKKAGDEHPLRIGGIVSTDEVDQDGERIIQEGLNFKPFLESGWYNDNHGKDTDDVVGYPTDAYFVKKGAKLPNNKIAKTNGWWAEGYLLDTKKGRDIWDIAQSLRKSPRRLGFSIEGSVRKRSPRNASVVTEAVVRHVAVTHVPVNQGTELDTLVKALRAGHAIDSGDMGGPGNAGALRSEALEGADDFQAIPEITEDELWAEWEPHLRANVQREVGLTKAEARVIVRREKPHLKDVDIDQIIKHALGGK